VNDTADRWVTGDHFGLPIPADPAALRAGGTTFLTQAFRASGALTADNAVSRISRFDEVPGGSTGRKLLLRVEYDKPDAGAHTDLFVKFSRDLHNPIRDRGKTQMESEVLFASLSGTPGFPITVPEAQFADYHRDTGTGILITERIRFGANGIERQYHKCIDYEMPEPLDHYCALLTALARLVGHHRSGCLPAGLISQFPVDLQAATVGEQVSISADKLGRRLSRLAEFAHTSPGLLPANVRSPQFLARLRNDAPRFLQHEPAVWNHLAAQTDYIALCHWNANVDNAWFWRDAGDDVHCGLLDWGCVGQMNVAMALWGAMSGAETDMWDNHLDDLLGLFVAVDTHVRRAGSRRERITPPADALCRDHGGRVATRRARPDPFAFRQRSSLAEPQRSTRQGRRERPRATADAHQRLEPLGENALRRSAYYCHDGLVVSTSGPLSVMTTVSRCSTAPTPSCHT